jgi:hypothetical protein
MMIEALPKKQPTAMIDFDKDGDEAEEEPQR